MKSTGFNNVNTPRSERSQELTLLKGSESWFLRRCLTRPSGVMIHEISHKFWFDPDILSWMIRLKLSSKISHDVWDLDLYDDIEAHRFILSKRDIWTLVGASKLLQTPSNSFLRLWLLMLQVEPYNSNSRVMPGRDRTRVELDQFTIARKGDIGE